jgi:hypothetical protein
MKHLSVFVLVVAGHAFAAASPVCEGPRLRDTSLLAAAAAQDKVVATAFEKAASTCTERGEACDQARVACGGLLTSILQRQAGFDEGVWLRDLLMPYLGQQYAPSRAFGTFTLARDASCNVDVAALIAASQRRREQAARREGLFQEYALFARWTDTALQRCRDRQAGAQQQSATAKAESEQLAAAAAAASAAELARKQAELDAKQRADEETRRLRAAQEAAAAQALEQQRVRELEHQRERAERLEFEQRNRAVQLEEQARAKGDRALEQKSADEKARLEQAQRFVSEREAKTHQARAAKRQLVEEAEANYKLALTEESVRRQAAMDAVSQSPAIAQAAVQQAAEAERNRSAAEHALAEARLKADRIEIDDGYERSRGHVGLLGGGGALGYTNSTDPGALTGGGLGAMVTAHVAFWGQAQASGLENGFEVALSARFFQTLGGGAVPREIEGHATARYFFGPLGLGLAGEGRSFDASYGIRSFGLGPALGIAAVDTPHYRVLINASWLPVGTAIDLTRITGEFEISIEWFTMRILGGSFNQALASGAKIGWQAAGFAGVRFTW